MAHTYKAQDYAANNGTEMKDRIAEQGAKAAEQVSRAAQSAQDQAAMVGENMKVVAGNLDTAVRRSIQDQPMTTLAMAAAVGFVLGAIWKS
jgi:ElaB/YqjD/DUF883 family membrane-anchored ribosome-binding protein